MWIPLPAESGKSCFHCLGQTIRAGAWPRCPSPCEYFLRLIVKRLKTGPFPSVENPYQGTGAPLRSAPRLVLASKQLMIWRRRVDPGCVRSQMCILNVRKKNQAGVPPQSALTTLQPLLSTHFLYLHSGLSETAVIAFPSILSVLLARTLHLSNFPSSQKGFSNIECREHVVLT